MGSDEQRDPFAESTKRWRSNRITTVILALVFLCAALLKAQVTGRNPVDGFVAPAVVAVISVIVIVAQPVGRRRARAREAATGALFSGRASLRDVQATKELAQLGVPLRNLRYPWWYLEGFSQDLLGGILAVLGPEGAGRLGWEPSPISRRFGVSAIWLDRDDIASVDTRRRRGALDVRVSITRGEVLSLTVYEPSRAQAVLLEAGLS